MEGLLAVAELLTEHVGETVIIAELASAQAESLLQQEVENSQDHGVQTPVEPTLVLLKAKASKNLEQAL
jgi:hypothetical protein